MKSLHVFLLQSDPGVSQSLVACFSKTFELIRQTPSLNDLRDYLAANPEGIVVVDMEIASLFEVEHLSHDFPDVRIICNHRLADERMWTQTLSAGADNCFPSNDTRGILRAAVQEPSRKPLAA